LNVELEREARAIELARLLGSDTFFVERRDSRGQLVERVAIHPDRVSFIDRPGEPRHYIVAPPRLTKSARTGKTRRTHMQVRAKMQCFTVDRLQSGDPGEHIAEIRLFPVYGDTPENAIWSKYTPSGEIRLRV
jgi:hypothetical protein